MNYSDEHFAWDQICLLGISHKTAPVDVRERFCLRPLEQELLLLELRNDPRVFEALVLSTCNRTEIYARLISSQPEILLKFLSRIKKIPITPKMEKFFYIGSGSGAVRHLFDVASGLDSIIIGEDQILGQVKHAAALSRQKGMSGRVFNILSNLVINTGKKVRRETSIGQGGSSISWAAVVEAQNVLKNLADKSAVVIGTGKTGHLVLQQLRAKDIRKLLVVNRTFEKAEELAREFHGEAVSFDDLRRVLSCVDVCFCSTDAPHFIIERKLIDEAMILREGRSMLLLDISMPRNIEPAVAEIPGITLIGIDDLGRVLDENSRLRMSAVGEVVRIINAKIKSLSEKLDVSLGHQPLESVNF